MNKKLKKIITATFTGGILTILASVNVCAYSNLQPDWYVDSFAGYKAGWASANVVGDEKYHYSHASVGWNSDTKYGYRYTMTDTVSGFGSFSHSSKWA